MERLTERIDDYIKIKGCKSYYPTVERKGAPATNAIVRLAAYEDTGIKPEDIQEVVDLLNEYIKPDDLPKELKSWAERCTWHVKKCVELRKEISLLKGKYHSLEVAAGKWIEDTFESTITCPVCHAKWSMIDNCTETFAHCPNCGARLE